MKEDAALEEIDVLRVERSGIFLLSALLSIGLLAGSLLGPFGAAELLLRVLLTAVLFAAPSLTRVAAPARRNLVVASILVVATLLICAISALAGGTRSPEFSCLIAVPFTAGLLLPQVRAVVWAVGLLVLCFGCAMLLAAGAPLSSVCMYAALLVAGTTAATLGTGVVRVFESRLAAERADRERAERRAEAERQRFQSDRLALLGRLAAGVAHEISNPLTYLSTNLQLLDREADALQKVAHRDVHAAVAESARAVESITDVLRDLRRFARSEAVGQPAATDVRAVLEEALLLASARLRGVQVERELGQDIPRVLVRRRRLVQVLVNLLFNAADAVAAPEARERRIRITAARVDGRVAIALEDSGPGLTSEARARLFEPFFTSKPPGKGMGLGLALSREYVQADGGTLAFEEAGKGGARVLVTLPLA
jgi:two-component system, NtrC family, sensor kinase